MANYIAIASPRATMETWAKGSHGSTYGGGNAVVAAAAIATVRTIREEGLVENPRDRGERLIAALRQIQAGSEVIGDVRGWGLMVATEFTRDGRKPAPEIAKAVSRACLERGLMLLTCGNDGNTIRWIPPLIVDDERIDDALSILDEALAQVG